MANAKRIDPGTAPDVARMAAEWSRRWEAMSASEQAEFDRRLVEAYPGGFNDRDEANALIAMAVRNGPLETLHAGKHSPLLEDPTLSRISDQEMKVLMLNATRALAALLKFRSMEPELYRRWLQTYGSAFCSRWEREP
jgi:hypothetical protein